jgi:hypothetical protein
MCLVKGAAVADRVLVRQVVTTVEADAGTEVWLEDGPGVEGMVAGGYWEVIERRSVKVKAKVVRDGQDQAGPDGSTSGSEPAGGA